MVNLLVIALLATSACNLGNYSRARSKGSVDASAIRKVVGLRNAVEINATMYVATTPNMKSVDRKPPADSPSDANIETNPPSPPDTSNPNRDTNCYQAPQGEGGKNKRGWNNAQRPEQSAFCRVKNLLPSDSQIESFSGNTQTGIFKLASHYCSQMMENSESGKQVRLDKMPTSAKEINKLDMQQRPVNLGKDLKAQLAKELLSSFAGSSTAKQRQMLVELIDELSETREENGQLPTLQEVLVGVCTAALGSANTVFY